MFPPEIVQEVVSDKVVHINTKRQDFKTAVETRRNQVNLEFQGRNKESHGVFFGLVFLAPTGNS